MEEEARRAMVAANVAEVLEAIREMEFAQIREVMMEVTNHDPAVATLLDSWFEDQRNNPREEVIASLEVLLWQIFDGAADATEEEIAEQNRERDLKEEESKKKDVPGSSKSVNASNKRTVLPSSSSSSSSSSSASSSSTVVAKNQNKGKRKRSSSSSDDTVVNQKIAGKPKVLEGKPPPMKQRKKVISLVLSSSSDSDSDVPVKKKAKLSSNLEPSAGSSLKKSSKLPAASHKLKTEDKKESRTSDIAPKSKLNVKKEKQKSSFDNSKEVHGGARKTDQLKNKDKSTSKTSKHANPSSSKTSQNVKEKSSSKVHESSSKKELKHKSSKEDAIKKSESIPKHVDKCKEKGISNRDGEKGSSKPGSNGKENKTEEAKHGAKRDKIEKNRKDTKRPSDEDAPISTVKVKKEFSETSNKIQVSSENFEREECVRTKGSKQNRDGSVSGSSNSSTKGAKNTTKEVKDPLDEVVIEETFTSRRQVLEIQLDSSDSNEEVSCKVPEEKASNVDKLAICSAETVRIPDTHISPDNVPDKTQVVGSSEADTPMEIEETSNNKDGKLVECTTPAEGDLKPNDDKTESEEVPDPSKRKDLEEPAVLEAPVSVIPVGSADAQQSDEKTVDSDVSAQPGPSSSAANSSKEEPVEPIHLDEPAPSSPTANSSKEEENRDNEEKSVGVVAPVDEFEKFKEEYRLVDYKVVIYDVKKQSKYHWQEGDPVYRTWIKDQKRKKKVEAEKGRAERHKFEKYAREKTLNASKTPKDIRFEELHKKGKQKTGDTGIFAKAGPSRSKPLFDGRVPKDFSVKYDLFGNVVEPPKEQNSKDSGKDKKNSWTLTNAEMMELLRKKIPKLQKPAVLAQPQPVGSPAARPDQSSPRVGTPSAPRPPNRLPARWGAQLNTRPGFQSSNKPVPQTNIRGALLPSRPNNQPYGRTAAQPAATPELTETEEFAATPEFDYDFEYEDKNEAPKKDDDNDEDGSIDLGPPNIPQDNVEFGDVARRVFRILQEYAEIPLPYDYNPNEPFNYHKAARWFRSNEKQPFYHRAPSIPEMHEEEFYTLLMADDGDDDISWVGNISNPDDDDLQNQEITSTARDSDEEDEFCGAALLFAKYRVKRGETADCFEDIFAVPKRMNYDKSTFKVCSYHHTIHHVVTCKLCSEDIKGKREYGNHLRGPKHRQNLANTSLKFVDSSQSICNKFHDEYIAEMETLEPSESVSADASESNRSGGNTSRKDKSNSVVDPLSKGHDDKRVKRPEKDDKSKRNDHKSNTSSSRTKDESRQNGGVSSNLSSRPSKDSSHRSRSNDRRRSKSPKRNRSRSKERERDRDHERARNRSRSPGKSDRHGKPRSRSPKKHPRHRASRSRSKSPRKRRASQNDDHHSRRVEEFLSRNEKLARRHSPPSSKSKLPGSNKQDEDLIFKEKLMLQASGRWSDDLEGRWKLMEDDEQKLKKLYAIKKKNLEEKPEDHPKYAEEWEKFWEKRYQELEVKGKNPDTYDYTSEWKQVWAKLSEKFLKQEHDAKLVETRVKYGVDLASLKRLNAEPLPTPKPAAPIQPSYEVYKPPPSVPYYGNVGPTMMHPYNPAFIQGPSMAQPAIPLYGPMAMGSAGCPPPFPPNTMMPGGPMMPPGPMMHPGPGPPMVPGPVMHPGPAVPPGPSMVPGHVMPPPAATLPPPGAITHDSYRSSVSNLPPQPVPPPIQVPAAQPTVSAALVMSTAGANPPTSSDPTVDYTEKPMSISSGSTGSVQIVKSSRNPSVTVDDIKSTWQNLTGQPIVSQSKLVEKADSIMSVSSNTSTPYDYMGTNALDVLRLLLELEDYLSFLATAVKDYFERVKEMETKEKDSSLNLLKEKDFVLLLHKLRDKIYAATKVNIASSAVKQKLNIAIFKLGTLLESPRCQKFNISDTSANANDNFNKGPESGNRPREESPEIEILTPRQPQNDIAAAFKHIPHHDTIRVSKTIAASLVAQGKNRVNDTTLAATLRDIILPIASKMNKAIDSPHEVLASLRRSVDRRREEHVAHRRSHLLDGPSHRHERYFSGGDYDRARYPPRGYVPADGRNVGIPPMESIHARPVPPPALEQGRIRIAPPVDDLSPTMVPNPHARGGGEGSRYFRRRSTDSDCQDEESEKATDGATYIDSDNVPYSTGSLGSYSQSAEKTYKDKRHKDSSVSQCLLSSDSQRHLDTSNPITDTSVINHPSNVDPCMLATASTSNLGEGETSAEVLQGLVVEANEIAVEQSTSTGSGGQLAKLPPGIRMLIMSEKEGNVNVLNSEKKPRKPPKSSSSSTVVSSIGSDDRRKRKRRTSRKDSKQRQNKERRGGTSKKDKKRRRTRDSSDSTKPRSRRHSDEAPEYSRRRRTHRSRDDHRRLPRVAPPRNTYADSYEPRCREYPPDDLSPRVRTVASDFWDNENDVAVLEEFDAPMPKQVTRVVEESKNERVRRKSPVSHTLKDPSREDGEISSTESDLEAISDAASDKL